MKIDGKTIPSPKNIKRREAFLLDHKDKLPSGYLQKELLKIAHTRADKRLRWNNAKEITEIAVIPKKPTFLDKISSAFKKDN